MQKINFKSKQQQENKEETTAYWLKNLPLVFQTKYAQEKALINFKSQLKTGVSFVNKKTIAARIEALKQILNKKG